MDYGRHIGLNMGRPLGSVTRLAVC